MYGDRGGRFGGPQGNPPVKQGDELDVTIEAVGEKGDSIAKKDGFVLFVPKTKQGERVRIKVTRVLAKVGFAESIGPASGAPTARAARPERPPEPEFDPQVELDSEDFGDEGK